MVYNRNVGPRVCLQFYSQNSESKQFSGGGGLGNCSALSRCHEMLTWSESALLMYPTCTEVPGTIAGIYNNENIVKNKLYSYILLRIRNM